MSIVGVTEMYGKMPREIAEDAGCKNTDPDTFISTIYVEQQIAKSICRDCDARELCLAWALESGEENGVWGGLNAKERRTLRRNGTIPIRDCVHCGNTFVTAKPGATCCSPDCVNDHRRAVAAAKRDAALHGLRVAA